MFDPGEFYLAAHNGDTVDTASFVEYARSFESLVLWGAGNLGTAMGEKLLQMGLNISAYWDVRAAELGTLHGVSVVAPFSGGFRAGKTLVVFCITNVFISDIVSAQLVENGYRNVLQGEDLYQALICPFDNSTPLDIRVCRDLPVCNVCTCKRLDKIIQTQNADNVFAGKTDPLHFPNITFIVNQVCTLNCKYCYAYTNNYPKEKRVNFPFERIREDIHRFFDAVDSVTLVPLIGGEPFLHPDLSKIVQEFLKKKNFGVLNVTTNGICKITEKDLEGFDDDRARVFFSNYLEALSPRQVEVFEKNIDFVRSQGVAAVVYNTTPQWTVPVKLTDKGFSDATIEEMKARCLGKETNGKYVKNGHFYPCTIIDSVHNLGIATYESDFLELDRYPNSLALRKGLIDLLAAKRYQTCRHCGDRGVITERAGVQGYLDYTKD